MFPELICRLANSSKRFWTCIKPQKSGHYPGNFPKIHGFMTNSQIRDTVLCRSVTKNLTDYRFNSAGWGLDDMKAEIHSFPTMYIIGGGKWGRNGSKLRFSEKKWSKNSFFEGHKSGSTDFGGVWHPYFWRYRYFPHVFWKIWSMIFELSYVQGVNLR